MGSLSFAEIITILIVILIIFGPNRLPEFARRLGELMAQARRATSQFTEEVTRDWGDEADTLSAVKEDYEGVKQDLKDATSAITGMPAASETPTEPVGEPDGVEDDNDGQETA